MKKIYTYFRFLLLITIMLHFLTGYAQIAVKKVLLEEYTTASCGMCPPASRNISNWHYANHTKSVLMTIHQGSGVDSMSGPVTGTIFNAFHPSAGWFAPAIMIDRAIYPWVDPEVYMVGSDFNKNPTPDRDSIAERVMNEPAKVAIDITGTYNSSTRSINATVSTTFVQSVPSGDWRINLFLVEDSVVGTPNHGPFAYDQKCYDASFANTYYPGMYNSSLAEIIGYPHRHVMRNSLLGNWGASGIIPSSPVVSTTYSTSTSFTVPAKYNQTHLSLVAFVSNYGTTKALKYVLNANEVKLTSGFTTQVEELKANDRVFIDAIFPMPTSGETHMIYTLDKTDKTQIILTDILGHTVKILSNKNTTAGQYEIVFDTKELAKGMYYIILSTSEYKAVKKLIVN